MLESTSEHTGWKIPETTLVFPWILRMFPDIKYIHWVRNPRDAMLNRHMTDNLNDFGIVSPEVQTLGWFVVTIAGVALASGDFFRWPIADRGVAVVVLLGLGWLVLHSHG